MLEAIETTAQYTNEKIDEIILQMNATYAYASSNIKWYSMELNQAIFSQPYIKQKNVGDITGAKSRTTLTNYMQKMVELGILSAKAEGREVFYINDDLVRILQR
jgi:Fic family protein